MMQLQRLGYLCRGMPQLDRLPHGHLRMTQPHRCPRHRQSIKQLHRLQHVRRHMTQPHRTHEQHLQAHRRYRHTESEGGVCDICNKRRMGVTECQAVREMQEGIQELIKFGQDA